MSEQHTTSAVDPERPSEESSAVEPAVLHETTPTTRPLLVKLGLVFLAFLAITLTFVTNPELLGSRDLTQLAIWIVALVAFVVILRILYRVVILTQTTYTVRDDAVRREFQLLYRHSSRELPFDHLWGHELTQGRIQAMLGYGTVAFLTGGNHRGLGFVEFEHVEQPRELRTHIREALADHEIEGDG